MNDRIACLNPKCGRTAKAESHPGDNEIVCSKCWKLLPKRLTLRYRQLSKRSRKGIRLAGKKERLGLLTDKQIDECDRLAQSLERLNWSAIRSFFREEIMPEDFNQFLEDGLLLEDRAV